MVEKIDVNGTGSGRMLINIVINITSAYTQQMGRGEGAACDTAYLNDFVEEGSTNNQEAI